MDNRLTAFMMLIGSTNFYGQGYGCTDDTHATYSYGFVDLMKTLTKVFDKNL